MSSYPDALASGTPEWEELFAKVRASAATAEERRRFWEIQQQRSEAILAAPVNQLYDVRAVQVDVPPTARILTSVVCTACGEPTMETRIRRLDGRELCPPCFDGVLAGSTAVGLRPSR